MGIEPTRPLLRGLKNTAFRDLEKTACDWRANFRVMRDNVGLRETPPFAIEFPLSTHSGRSRASASGYSKLTRYVPTSEAICLNCDPSPQPLVRQLRV
jgi:hypothetical protein